MNPFSNSKNTTLNYDLFLLCQEKNTGTLFLQTNRQKSAQVSLQHGVITKMSFEDKNGLEAIEDFKTAVYSKTQFIPYFSSHLSTQADIKCSKTALSMLGYDEYLEEINCSTESVI